MTSFPARREMGRRALAIPIVILAGGQGGRIGGDKPGRILGRRSLVDRSIDYARSRSNKVAIAVRTPGRFENIEEIADRPGIEGPLAGVAASLAVARARGWPRLATIPCDMPFLPTDLITRLASVGAEVPAVIAASGGRLHPVCGLWRSDAIDSLAAYLTTGRRSLRGFAGHVGYRTCRWTASPDPFFNVNDADDLAEAARLLTLKAGLTHAPDTRDP